MRMENPRLRSVFCSSMVITWRGRRIARRRVATSSDHMARPVRGSRERDLRRLITAEVSVAVMLELMLPSDLALTSRSASWLLPPGACTLCSWRRRRRRLRRRRRTKRGRQRMVERERSPDLLRRARAGAHQPDAHRQLLQDGHHVRVVETEQLAAVYLQQLVATVEAAVLAHRPVGQDRPDVVVRILLRPVHLLYRPLQADPQPAALRPTTSDQLALRAASTWGRRGEE